MTTLLPADWPAWIAAATLILMLAENALGVTGIALFARDGLETGGGGR